MSTFKYSFQRTVRRVTYCDLQKSFCQVQVAKTAEKVEKVSKYVSAHLIDMWLYITCNSRLTWSLQEYDVVILMAKVFCQKTWVSKSRILRNINVVVWACQVRLIGTARTASLLKPRILGVAVPSVHDKVIDSDSECHRVT